MRAGGAGCISATANVNPAAIHKLFAEYQTSSAEQQQADLNRIRAIFQNLPMIAALKAATAHFADDPEWLRVRPPITPLSEAQHTQLHQQMNETNFQMPGL